jgi:hypothetical protein
MSPKVHFDISPSPPSYSPPPSYASHSFGENGAMSFAQMERMASIAESKLSYLVSQKRREPSLRRVLLHAGFLEHVLDRIDSYSPEREDDEPMIDEIMPAIVPAERPELHSSLSTIIEVDEMEIDSDSDSDEEEDDEEMPPLKRTVSHRPGSPVSSDEEEDSDSDDDLPSPPPAYTPPKQDHPLINLFEVREKARRDDLSNHYHISHEEESLFLLHSSLAVAA